MKPLVYIAAPYSGDLAKNIRTASRVFRDLFDSKIVTPYCPHWSVVGDLCCPMTYEQWMEHSIAMLQRCDAVLVMFEPSPGVKREMEAADSFGIPVFLGPAPLLAWAKEWTRQRQDDNRTPTEESSRPPLDEACRATTRANPGVSPLEPSAYRRGQAVEGCGVQVLCGDRCVGLASSFDNADELVTELDDLRTAILALREECVAWRKRQDWRKTEEYKIVSGTCDDATRMAEKLDMLKEFDAAIIAAMQLTDTTTWAMGRPAL